MQQYDGAVVIILFQVPLLEESVVDVLIEVKHYEKPILCVASGGNFTKKMTSRLEHNNIPVYPTPEQEIEIVNRFAEEWTHPELKPTINKTELARLQRLVRQVPVANDIKDYIVRLISKTRHHKELIEFGASPRASIGLTLASKASALMQGRNYVTKEDVHEMALPVLRHRLILNFEAERNNFDEDAVIQYLLK